MKKANESTFWCFHLVIIAVNDWNKMNSQLKSLYRLRPIKNE